MCLVNTSHRRRKKKSKGEMDNDDVLLDVRSVVSAATLVWSQERPVCHKDIPVCKPIDLSWFNGLRFPLP